MARRASIPNTPGDFLLESLYAGVLGGSAVALFFLVADLLDGRPFFTPSLIGSDRHKPTSRPLFDLLPGLILTVRSF